MKREFILNEERWILAGAGMTVFRRNDSEELQMKAWMGLRSSRGRLSEVRGSI